jgi:hypothetical protein
MKIYVGEKLARYITRKEINPSLDHIRNWLMLCIEQGGFPEIRSSWGPFYKKDDRILVVCHGGVGEEMTEYWVLGKDIVKDLRKHRGKDVTMYFLEKFAPDVKEMLLDRYKKQRVIYKEHL